MNLELYYQEARENLVLCMNKNFCTRHKTCEQGKPIVRSALLHVVGSCEYKGDSMVIHDIERDTESVESREEGTW